MSSLKNKTVFITGGSRGIGRAIALRCAADGANVVIAAKSAEPHPKLPGTIYSVAEEIIAAGGKALPLQVDVREEEQVIAAMQKAADTFGGIDIVINNAGAIGVTNVESTSLKKYDLMHGVNHRATFICAKAAIPFLRKSENGHILSLSPPLNMDPKWLGMFAPYTVSKYGMTILTLGLAAELASSGVSANTLWPRTYIATAAVEVNSGGKEVFNLCRKPEIMADAAYAIITSPKGSRSGQSFLDEDVLRAAGITDFTGYAWEPANADRLQLDFYVD